MKKGYTFWINVFLLDEKQSIGMWKNLKYKNMFDCYRRLLSKLKLSSKYIEMCNWILKNQSILVIKTEKAQITVRSFLKSNYCVPSLIQNSCVLHSFCFLLLFFYLITLSQIGHLISNISYCLLIYYRLLFYIKMKNN